MVTGEQWVEMFGRARLADGVSELESDMIRLGRASGALRAVGSVFLIARSADPPVFVQSARLQSAGDGEPLDFTGGALLRRDQTEVSAGRIEVDPDGGAFLAEGEVDSVMTDMRVRSDRLRFDEGAGRVEYSGNVHAETSEFTLRSGWLGLDVERGEVGRVEAAEAVSVVSVAGVRAAGEEALYDRESGTLTVYGPASEVVDPENGRCTGEEIVITLESRDVAVRGGQADRAVCSPPVAPHTSTTGG
jgi:lipopolysaccharide export system protein LptA